MCWSWSWCWVLVFSGTVQLCSSRGCQNSVSHFFVTPCKCIWQPPLGSYGAAGIIQLYRATYEYLWIILNIYEYIWQPPLGPHGGAGTPAALRDARRVQGTPRDWVLNLVLCWCWCWWLLVAIVAQFFLIPSQLFLTYYLPLFQHRGPYLREPRGTSR